MIIGVMLAVILEILDSSIVNVALPTMMGNLGATVDEISWVATSYIVANVIVIPMTNFFAARFGRRRYFVGSILLFTFASFLCGAARTLPELVVFRVIQGLGGGALLALGQSIMVETFPRRATGNRAGDLRRRRDARPEPRPDARRLDHRRVGVAVDLLRQRAARHRRGRVVLELPAGAARRHAPPPRTRGLARHRAARGGHRVAADPARERPPQRLVREQLHRRARRCVGDLTGLVHLARTAHRTPGRGPARVPPPRAGGGLRLRHRDGDRSLRQRLPVSALHPERDGAGRRGNRAWRSCPRRSPPRW